MSSWKTWHIVAEKKKIQIYAEEWRVLQTDGWARGALCKTPIVGTAANEGTRAVEFAYTSVWCILSRKGDRILQPQQFLLDGLPPLLNGPDRGSVRSLDLRSGIQRPGSEEGFILFVVVVVCVSVCVCLFCLFHQLCGAWLGSTLPEWSSSALSQSESSYRPWFHRKTNELVNTRLSSA